MNDWELVLIDDASQQLLAAEFDLNWYPDHYWIREERLGLTHARFQGATTCAMSNPT